MVKLAQRSAPCGGAAPAGCALLLGSLLLLAAAGCVGAQDEFVASAMIGNTVPVKWICPFVS
jgi:hypothetical protein